VGHELDATAEQQQYRAEHSQQHATELAAITGQIRTTETASTDISQPSRTAPSTRPSAGIASATSPQNSASSPPAGPTSPR
jgi:hypothetical protein